MASVAGSSSSAPPPSSSPRPKLTLDISDFLFGGLTFALVDAGLPDPELADLDAEIPRHGGVLLSENADYSGADYLLTGLGSARRIGRYVPKHKPDLRVLRREFVFDCVRERRLLDTAAYEIGVPDEYRPDRRLVEADERVRRWAREHPDLKQAAKEHLSALDAAASQAKRRRMSPSPSPSRLSLGSASISSRSSSPMARGTGSEGETDTDSEDGSAALDPSYPNVRHECQRFHPLTSPNDDLIEPLDIIARSRYLEGNETSFLAYSHAAAALRSYPRRVRSAAEAVKVKGIGTKIAHIIREVLKTGGLKEAERIRTDERFKTLDCFAKIYGVGATTAREWWNRGYRTVEGIARAAEENAIRLNPSQDMGVRYFSAFSAPMDRDDVAEVVAVVREALDAVDPKLEHEVCGGYRRGKLLNGDVDVVITHPDAGEVPGLLGRIVKQLERRGVLVDILTFGEGREGRGDARSVSQKAFGGRGVVEWVNPSSMGAFRGAHFDVLDKAFVVLSQPSSGKLRQLDLIVTPPANYPVAVVGWSGSTLFQRSLREWARLHGMHFASHGLFDRVTGERIEVESEEGLFEKLGLRYVPPEMRNA